MRGPSCLGAVVIALVAVACGVPTDHQPRPIPRDRVPLELFDPAPPPTTASGATAQAAATVFMVVDDHLTPVRRDVPAPASPDTVLRVLLAGVVPDEAAQNIRTALSSATRPFVTVEPGGRLQVELTPAFLATATQEQVLAVAQIVYTLTELPGVDAVSFTVSGRAVEVPTGDGTLKSGPVRRADFASLAKS